MRILKFVFRTKSITPAEDCVPTKYGDLLKKLEKDIQIEDAGSGDSVNIGATTPTPANTGKPWIARGKDGAPAGLFQYWKNKWVNMGFRVGDQIYFHGPVELIIEPWFLADGTNDTLNRSADFDEPNNLFIKEWRGF